MTLLRDIAGGVATLTLDRPEARNALSMEMCLALLAACREIALHEEVRVVFVRANGPAFCAGADLKERAGRDEAWVRERRMNAFAAYEALESLPMPCVALVHGAVVGSGVEIAASCDFIVAAPDATFRTPEAQRGTVGATQRLPRILGKRLAKDLMFTGRTLSAEEALRGGLVTRVVSDLESEMKNIIENMVKAPPQAMRLAKRCIDRGVELDPAGALALEIEAIEEQLQSGKWMGKK